MCLAALLTGQAVSAQDLSELRERKEEIEAERAALSDQQAAVAGNLSVEQATYDEITAALEAINADLALKEDKARQAQDAVGRANDQVALAQIAQNDAIAEAQQLEGELERLAVQAYVDPPGTEIIDAMLSGDVLEAPYRRVFLEATASRQTSALDEYRSIRGDLAQTELLAAEAVDLAAQRQAAADDATAEVELAKARQEEFAAEVDDRIDRLLSEAASLEALDADFAAELRSTESAISSRLAEIEAAARARAARNSRPSGNLPASGEIVNVQGIWVHESIADDLDALLNAARADGINFGGGGYRSNARQIELRRAHCGSSDYAIYQMPASSCRPPTARPGRSNHERGLAIDFTYNGRAISSRSSPGYQWLAANASRYGLFNLPSEPWHWSVNGN